MLSSPGPKNSSDHHKILPFLMLKFYFGLLQQKERNGERIYFTIPRIKFLNNYKLRQEWKTENKFKKQVIY
jgi:hypothetical protein